MDKSQHSKHTKLYTHKEINASFKNWVWGGGYSGELVFINYFVYKIKILGEQLPPCGTKYYTKAFIRLNALLNSILTIIPVGRY